MAPHEETLRLFKSLTVDERSSLIEKLQQQATSSETEIIENAEIVCCPHCEPKLFVKNGKRGSTHRYKCKACCRIFTSRTGTSLHRIQKPDKFELYKSLMLEAYYPIKQIAKKVGISVQAAFDWRHKVLSSIDKGNTTMFDGITEVDDIWFLYSQKGRKGLDYSRKRGGSKRAGDNGFQAKLPITADRNRKADISLACIGRLKKADIERKISGQFTKNCTLVSYKHRSIAPFAKSEGLKHVSFKSSGHTAGGEYHVQNVK